MLVTGEVVYEDVRQSDGVEYVTITSCEAIGPSMLLGMYDYTLRADEKQHKGKLVGKIVSLRVQTIRDVFNQRAQFVGHIAEIKNSSVK